MKIALVSPKSTFLINPMVYPPLGLWYLASRLESLGHTCEYFDLNRDELPKDGDFNQLFLSATSPQIQEIRNLGEIFFSWRSTKTVLGGPAPWTNPLPYLEIGYDLVVSGEADSPNAIQKILDMGRGYVDVGVDSELDWVIPPQRRWSHRYNAHLGPYRTTTMFTTRGCPMSCAFCESGRLGKIWNSRVRFEPNDSLASQVVSIKELGFEAIQFYDDILPLNKLRMEFLMRLLAEYELKWRCFLRSDVILKQGGFNYLRDMRDTGLLEVLVGIESADNNIKNNINKGTTIEQDTEVLEYCKELGISFKASIILGLPGETQESMQATRDWILKYRPDRADINTLIPFPGTPIVDNLEKYDLQWDVELPETFWYKGPREESQCIVSTSNLTSFEIGRFRDSLVAELEKQGIPY